jgi:S1-C subfamily serine protease
MIFFKRFAILLALIAVPTISIGADISPAVLENIRKGVITIDSRISISAYNDTGNFKGTGFIADKNSGLVVTNAHVVNPASIGTYYATFFNGKQSEAKLLYYDSWQDFAILKIDPKEFPEDTKNIPFSKEPAKLGQDVFIVGNNEAQDFSFHSGYLANLYDINGGMPQHTYVVNLNVSGGSSGSPLVNLKGEALGINYGGSQTYGLSLKGEYITYALKMVKYLLGNM